MDNVKGILGDKIDFASSQYDALEGADALLICTEWQVFRTPDFDLMLSKLKHPAVFDGRNLYDTKEMKESGFDYFSIGR